MPSPLEQARQYAHEIVNLLHKDPALIVEHKARYRGKLLFPWSYGVVLANLTPSDLIHIPQGFVPVVAGNGLMQISFSVTDPARHPEIETREDDAHLRILLDSLAEALALNSGIDARVVTEPVTVFFNSDPANATTRQNNAPPDVRSFGKRMG